MSTQLTSVTVILNNEVIGIVPNSLTYDDGHGEQQLRPVSIGGGKTETTYAEDVESNYGMVAFDVHATIDNIATTRAAKLNKNRNVLQLVAENADGDFTRTFTGAAITGKVEVSIASEGNISLQFQTNPAI